MTDHAESIDGVDNPVFARLGTTMSTHETEAIREEARKTAAEKRKSRVEDAAAAF